MEYKVCPNCGTYNNAIAWKCRQCGNDLPQETIPGVDIEITYSPSRITNYAALKKLGQILKILAWIIGIGGVLSLFASLGHLDGGGYYSSGPDASFYILLGSGIINLFAAAIFLVFSESINVILDIEANTRQSAKTLGKILDAQ